MKHDLLQLRLNSEAIEDYVSAESIGKDHFQRRRSEYSLDSTVASELKKFASMNVIYVFSAEWCPDCYKNIPVLDLLAKATNIEVRVFGHLIRDTKSNTDRWKIPPSPAEVKEFDVIKIPLIILLNKKGEELGKIIENPRSDMSLEKEILEIMTKH